MIPAIVILTLITIMVGLTGWGAIISRDNYREKWLAAEVKREDTQKELDNLRNSISGDADALSRANARAEAAENGRLKLADECGRLRGYIIKMRDDLDKIGPLR